MASDCPAGDVAAQTLAVERVLSAYCYAVDARDVEAVVVLFDERCEFDWGLGRVARGHAGIRELLESLSRWEATSHHLANVIVDIDDNGTARARSYVYAWHKVAGTGVVEQLWGQYHDELAWSSGGWRFTRRRLRAAGEDGFALAPGQAGNFERLRSASSK
jgi:hypothetical protein